MIMKFYSQGLGTKLSQITENKLEGKILASTTLQYTVYRMITGLTGTKVKYWRRTVIEDIRI